MRKGVESMKVLQINCVYGEGSTGKITRDIHTALLAHGDQSVVLCGRRGKRELPYINTIVPEWYAKLNHFQACITGVVYGGCLLSTEKIKRIIRKENPDIVHLQCINGFFCNIFRLLEFLKQSGMITVLTLHAEFMYTANCSHAGRCDQWINGCQKCPERKAKLHSLLLDRTSESWKRMHAVYKNWDKLHVVACSEWIAARALQSGEMARRDVRIIRNGIDNTAVYYPQNDAYNRVQKVYRLPHNKKYVLYVSPGFSHLKGFDLLVDLIKQCEDEALHFLLVGGEAELELSNTTVIGSVSDQHMLADLYSASDAMVVCSRNDTYPTVCLEATSCGTPVVAFDVGGVRETIKEGMGEVVPLGDIAGMKQKLLEVVKSRPNPFVVQNVRRIHSKERMTQEYRALYHDLLKDNIE